MEKAERFFYPDPGAMVPVVQPFVCDGAHRVMLQAGAGEVGAPRAPTEVSRAMRKWGCSASS